MQKKHLQINFGWHCKQNLAGDINNVDNEQFKNQITKVKL